MSISKKLIFMILMILVIAAICIGNIVFSSSITYYSGGRVYISFSSPYASYNDNTFKDFYCIQRGASVYDAYYSVSGWHQVEDPALAYILSLNINASRGYDIHNSKNNEIQHLLWYYIDHRNNNDTIAMKYNGANITGGGIGLNTGAYYPINGTNYSESELWNMASEYANRANLEDINLTLSLNGTNVRATWTGNAQNYTIYLNGSNTAYRSNITDKSIDIPITEFGTNPIARVKITASQEQCTAKFRVYVSGSSQNILQKEGSRTTISKEDEKTIDLNTNVSLQKYITKINNSDLTTNDTALTDRKNTYTSADENNVLAKKVVSKSEEEKMKSANTYKKEKIVNIEAGDTVTYRVYIYNNSSVVDAKSILVKDTIPYVENNGVVTSLATIESIKDANGGNVSWTVDTSKDKNEKLINKNTYQYTINNLQHGASTFFDITLKYNEYNSGIITNTAWISNTDPKNDETYRTVDRDYVKMKEYKVSLEKFVSQVTDKDGNNVETYTSTREGKRYNDNASTDENKNTYKPNNKVGLEVGDIVTYTIRLKNTGDTNVKITQIYDSFDTKNSGVKLEYVSSYGIKGNGNGKIVNSNYSGNSLSTDNLTNYLIKFDNAETLQPGKTTDVTLQFRVVVPSSLTNQSHVLDNRACIVELKNKNNIDVTDGDGTDNNRDQDYVVTKIYAVSLEKFVYKVNGYELCDFNNDNKVDSADVTLMQRYLSGLQVSNEALNKIMKYGDLDYNEKITEEDITKLQQFIAFSSQRELREGYAEHNYDDDTSTNNSWKHNHVVNVSQGDSVTYTIKLKNDGTTSVYITEVTDFLPDGIKYGEVTYSGGQYDTTTNNEVKFNGTRINGNVIIAPGGTASFDVTVTVTESNMSLNILKNTARITEMKNRNEMVVEDTTPNNNEDSDYLQLNYPGNNGILSGMVWNDINPVKNNSSYNALYQGNGETEKKLSGVKVYLYRNGINTAIATKTTDSNGYYHFADTDIDEDVITNSKYRHIKGPIDTDSNRWAGTFYSYYIVFEYDGITYTATPDGKTCVSVTDSTAYNNGTYKINSNAKEDYGRVKETRSSFNSKYATINNASNIDYKTLNENEYMPQSIHKYNSAMAMQSSTGLIQLSNNSTLEEEIKYINLGLRGRDTFDLELHSDVFSTKVTVNGQQGEYKYNSNRVDVRKSDMAVEEDIENVAKESRTGTVSEVTQTVRETDIDKDKANNSKIVNRYTSTGLGIEVTYKITVTNISNTDGTATKIVNYYDNNYKFERAYYDKGALTAQTSDSGNGFNSVVITTQETNLSRNDTMDIYVVYTLKTPTNTLKPLLNGTKMIPTFNMAEIYEYKTQRAQGQTEYTRGLIDINSAPGSANREQVRTTNTVGQDTPTVGGNPTTAQYYFNKKSNANVDLSILKYEDDTYAAPTLYFATDGGRKLEGQVFEDKTTVNSERVRSGNGIKDSGEIGIYGVTVILKEGNVERYKTTSGTDGKYEFTDFLPGNYTIEYRYGDTKKTVLQKQSGNVNAKSYNGEDYQSTNNAYDVKDIIVNKLDKTPNFWYLFNESKKVSVADDVETRRTTVSNNVSNFTEAEMINLNNIRAGNSVSDEVYTNIKNKTQMNALTDNLTITVEKSVIDDNKVKQRSSYADYVISGMDFGLAEVPVTTIDLQKHISKFEIKDSARNNVIASYDKATGTKVGDILPLDNIYDVSIEDEKLQGSHLEITFNISAKTNTERDFRNNLNSTIVTIDGIVDFIDNDLLYNDLLGGNNGYWEASSFEEVKKIYGNTKALNNETAKGTVDPDGTLHTSVVKAKEGNPLLKYEEGKEQVCPITLEKVLSGSNASLGDIITSSIMSYEYDNDVEILKLNYENTHQDKDKTALRDRVRTPSRFTILAGTQYDNAHSETLSIHPPTGNNKNIIYYIIGASALAILAVGVVLIKKYAIKKD